MSQYAGFHQLLTNYNTINDLTAKGMAEVSRTCVLLSRPGTMLTNRRCFQLGAAAISVIFEPLNIIFSFKISLLTKDVINKLSGKTIPLTDTAIETFGTHISSFFETEDWDKVKASCKKHREKLIAISKFHPSVRAIHLLSSKARNPRLNRLFALPSSPRRRRQRCSRRSRWRSSRLRCLSRCVRLVPFWFLVTTRPPPRLLKFCPREAQWSFCLSSVPSHLQSNTIKVSKADVS